MVVIKIEMWPGGDEKLKRDIGTCLIKNQINHGSGDDQTGNYKFELYDKLYRIYRTGEVLNFPRKRKNAWHLLREVLTQAFDYNIR